MITSYGRTNILVCTILVLFSLFSCETRALSNSDSFVLEKCMNRRHALISTTSIVAGIVSTPESCYADDIRSTKAENVSLDAIKLTQKKSSESGILKLSDPPSTMSLRRETSIKIPRVGHSFYKTSPDQAARCFSLALRAGVRHFDLASQYGSNGEISRNLKVYLDRGIDAIDYSNEKPEFLELLDATNKAGKDHSIETLTGGVLSVANPTPVGSSGRRGRRESVFISHKLSNFEQSIHRVDVRRSIKREIEKLGSSYLDMVSIHSPLTDVNRRVETYAALLELRDAGFIRAVGVSNYGLKPLEEIKEAGLELPSVNQLELSPFNTHENIVSWCGDNRIALACSAWSKLSSQDGPQDQWAVLGEISKKKGMTKAQVLVRWSLQRGYICVPRSGSQYKIEKIAISENSYGGVNNKPSQGCILSSEEMQVLDSLNVDLKAGKLGRRDGWYDVDIADSNWDPTSV